MPKPFPLTTDGSLVYYTTDGVNFESVGGGGSSTVHTDATMTGDGSVGSPLHAIPTFGSDTTVPLADATSVDVTALELIATLTTNTHGSCASDWTVKLLAAGSQVTALHLLPAAALLPSGAVGAPSVSFQAAPTYGMWYDAANTRVAFSAGGAIRGAVNASGIAIPVDGGGYFIGSTGNVQMIQDASTGDLKIFAGFANVSIGGDGALATNAAVGFLEIPTCAGTPTGTVVVRSGKVAIVYDTTNNKIGVTAGGGTWKQTAALT